MTPDLATVRVALTNAIEGTGPADLPGLIAMLAEMHALASAKLLAVAARAVAVTRDEARLLDASEVAARLGIKESSASDLMRKANPKIPIVVVGQKYVRVKPSDLDEYIRQKTKKPLDTYNTARIVSGRRGHGDGRAATEDSTETWPDPSRVR